MLDAEREGMTPDPDLDELPGGLPQRRGAHSATDLEAQHQQLTRERLSVTEGSLA